MSDSPPSLKSWATHQRDNPLATIDDFNEVFNTAPEGGGVKMIKKLGAKNKGMTKDGSRPRWGILVDGQWWNTINPHHGEVIDGLKQGDEIEVTLVERGNFKNVDSIEPVVDVNEEVPEWDDGEPMPEPPPDEEKKTKKYAKKDDDRTTSIVRQALLKAGGGVSLPEFVWKLILADVLGKDHKPGEVCLLVAQRHAAYTKIYAKELEPYAKGE